MRLMIENGLTLKTAPPKTSPLEISIGIEPTNCKFADKNSPNLNCEISFADFCEAFYILFCIDTKRSSKTDLSKIRNHLNPKFGKMRIGSITRQSIDFYLQTLAKTHSPATVNRHLALLSSIFKLAELYGVIAINPCKGIKKRIENNKLSKSLNDDEIYRLRNAMHSEGNSVAGAALLFLLSTGARREEVLQARWQDVDINKGILTIPHNKSGEVRHLVMNDSATEILKMQIRLPGNEYVFPGKNPGQPIRNVRKAFSRILKQAGLPHLRIHDLRHVFASTLVANGVTLYTVQKLLGHKNSQTTERYAHLNSEELLKASQKMSAILNKIN